MAGDIIYYPSNGMYVPIPGTIYAQYYGTCPNPCRKYHVSSALEGAETVASVVLPLLSAQGVFHKIVKSQSLLAKQADGKQAGKFITIYMEAHVSQRNGLIVTIGQLLAAELAKGNVSPSPGVPKSRAYSHVFIEQPLDDEMFVYGGFVCDPSD